MKSKLKSQIRPLRASGDNGGELLSAGVNINIPPKTWLYMGFALGIPAVAVVLLLIVKEAIKK